MYSTIGSSNKVVPANDEIVEIIVSKAESSQYKSALPGEFFRDAMTYLFSQKAGRSSVLQKEESKIIEEVMRHGSIDCGNGCKAIKCPSEDKPAVCGIFLHRLDGHSAMICTGPTVQETKGGIIRSKKKVYNKEMPKRTCEYSPLYLFDENALKDTKKFEKLVKEVYRILRNHPDYEVKDFLEESEYDDWEQVKKDTKHL